MLLWLSLIFANILKAFLMWPAFERGVSGRRALAHVWKAERINLGYESCLYWTFRAIGLVPIHWAYDLFFAVEVTRLTRES